MAMMRKDNFVEKKREMMMMMREKEMDFEKD